MSTSGRGSRSWWASGFIVLISGMGLIMLSTKGFESSSRDEMLSTNGQGAHLDLKWDSPQARSVAHWQSKVDELYGKLNKAEIHLAHLTHRVLESDGAGASSHLKARKQSLRAVRATDALASAVEEAQQHVDTLSAALEDAQKKLDGKVDLVVDAQTLAHEEGKPGPRGPQGRKGAPGPQGAPGDQGSRGIAGLHGPGGPRGQDGQQGERGPTGDQGLQGPRGYEGVAGPEGYPGPVGGRGDAGTPGPRGPPGSRGPPGNQGPPGAQGRMGAVGAQGAAGVTHKKGTQSVAATSSSSSSTSSSSSSSSSSTAVTSSPSRKARASQLAAVQGSKGSIARAKKSVERSVKAAERDYRELKKEEAELRSGKEVGPDAKRGEQRRAVQRAFKRFYAHRLAEKTKEAKEDKVEAKEGIDVTPDKHCQGTNCNVEVFIESPTPKVDKTFLTGHFYHPSLEGLRNAVRERGELSLALPEPKCVGTHGGNGCDRIAAIAPGDTYHMTFDLPGKSATVGGYKNSGKVFEVGHPDPRVPPHALTQQGEDETTPSSPVAAKLHLDIGGGPRGKVLPAAATLVREEAALRQTAKRIEKVADARAREAAEQDEMVRSAISALTGEHAAQPATMPAKQHQSMLAKLQLEEAKLRQEQESESDSTTAGPVDAQRWLGRHGGLMETEGALENAASAVGNTLISYLPLYLAQKDLAASQPKSAGDPAFAPILSGQKDQSAVVGQARGQSLEGGRRLSTASQPPKPVHGVRLGSVRAQAAKLEGSLEESLQWLAPTAPANQVQTVVDDLSDLSSEPDFAAVSSSPTAAATSTTDASSLSSVAPTDSISATSSPSSPLLSPAETSSPLASPSSLSPLLLPADASKAAGTQSDTSPADADRVAHAAGSAVTLERAVHRQLEGGTLSTHLGADLGAARGVAKALARKVSALHGAKAKAMQAKLAALQGTLQ